MKYLFVNMQKLFKCTYCFSLFSFKTVKKWFKHGSYNFHTKRNISTFAIHYSKTIPKYANAFTI